MVDVTIYTRMMCGYCSAAKRLLDSKGVAYTEHDASFSPELRKEMPADAPLIVAGDFNDWRKRAHDMLAREVGVLRALGMRKLALRLPRPSGVLLMQGPSFAIVAEVV